MISEGQIALFKFPQTDQQEGKLRPALVLRKMPGQYDDWLICMISSKLHHKIQEIDEVITLIGRHRINTVKNRIWQRTLMKN